MAAVLFRVCTATFLPISLGLSVNEVPEEDAWWSESDETKFEVFDQSWLTPRLVCGIQFLRKSAKVLDNGAQSAALKWTFDGADFLRRGQQFYNGGGTPPLRQAWFLTLFRGVPGSRRWNTTSGASHLDMQCAAVNTIAIYMYLEYLAFIVPRAILLKLVSRSFKLHQRAGFDRADESVPTLLARLRRLDAVDASEDSFIQAFRRVHASLPPSRAIGDTCADEARVLVDVVVARCEENLSWLHQWFEMILHDEWTPEVCGVLPRVLIFQRCGAIDDDANARVEKIEKFVANALQHRLIAPGSAVIHLTEPPGFEHVAYVHYLLSQEWEDSNFTFFLHGAPFDHLDAQILQNSLRALALGTYTVPFLHLNVKRLPVAETHGCIKDFLAPALLAWQHGLTDRDLAIDAPLLPSTLDTYCCAQFIVSRERLNSVPRSFWKTVWDLLLHGRSPDSCHDAAARTTAYHRERGRVLSEDFALWGEVLELTWHWIFGEAAELQSREDDARLPLFLRAPHVRASRDGGPRGTTSDLVDMPDWGFDPGWWGAPEGVQSVTGSSMVRSVPLVPTRLFAAAARDSWEFPPRVAGWRNVGHDLKCCFDHIQVPTA